jgi:hypothetical protein
MGDLRREREGRIAEGDVGGEGGLMERSQIGW